MPVRTLFLLPYKCRLKACWLGSEKVIGFLLVALPLLPQGFALSGTSDDNFHEVQAEEDDFPVSSAAEGAVVPAGLFL